MTAMGPGEEPLGVETDWRWQLLPITVLLGVALDKAYSLSRIRRSKEDKDNGSNESKDGFVHFATILVAIVVYFTSSPGIIILNKKIMTKMGFPFPIFVTNLGNVFLSLLTRCLAKVGVLQISNPNLPLPTYIRTVVPLAFFSGTSSILGNSAYMYISLPLIQILKSGTLVMVMILGFVMKVERFSWRVVCAIVCIVSGVAVATGCEGLGQQKDTMSFCIGVGLMLMANMSEAGRVVYLQVSMQQLNFFDSLYWCTPVVTAFCLITSAILEGPQMLNIEFTQELCGGFACSILLGSVVTFSTFWLTNLVGGLTMKVLVSARNIGLVLFAAVVLKEPCAELQYVGYSGSLIGLAVYERAKRKAPAPPTCSSPTGKRTT